MKIMPVIEGDETNDMLLGQESGFLHSIREPVETRHERGRRRTTARISQVVDCLFYLIYGVIGLQFMVRLIGARSDNGFVHFVGRVSQPALALFGRIMSSSSNGSHRIELSYLLALMVYILLHSAVNETFHLIAHRKGAA